MGEDAHERAFAREAGIRTAAPPGVPAMENRPLLRTRIELSDSLSLPELTAAVNETEAVVVQTVSDRPALAMATTQGTEALECAGFTVDLRGPVDDTAAFPIRDYQPVSAAESLADAPHEAP
ncbi:hypothetical protein [Streptomyces sp. NPDC019890]|uniref:hypothetical protein n=1 Tax=Streptomyces sp. NPDC019890 TaxID=3365064 RepID=UPI00384C7DB0